MTALAESGQGVWLLDRVASRSSGGWGARSDDTTHSLEVPLLMLMMHLHS